MRVSVVTSLFRSAPYIEQFYRRCIAAIGSISQDIEFVFVDDGSPDDSLQVVQRLFSEPAAIKLVQLSRNYGAARALMTGLEHASGDLVFLLDCDLEEPPELFPRLYAALGWDDDGKPAADVAYAVQQRRKGDAMERLLGGMFYRVFNVLSAVRVPADVMNCRLMTQRYVRALVAHHEREIFFLGLTVLAGYKQVAVPGKKESKGSTSYTLSRKLAITINAVTSFSDRPLYLIFILGATVSTLAFVGIVFLVIDVLALGYPYQPGWSSLLLAVSFFGGLTLAALGVVGLYLGRVLMEVKQRPCIVQSVIENKPDQ